MNVQSSVDDRKLVDESRMRVNEVTKLYEAGVFVFFQQGEGCPSKSFMLTDMKSWESYAWFFSCYLFRVTCPRL